MPTLGHARRRAVCECDRVLDRVRRSCSYRSCCRNDKVLSDVLRLQRPLTRSHSHEAHQTKPVELNCGSPLLWSWKPRLAYLIPPFSRQSSTFRSRRSDGPPASCPETARASCDACTTTSAAPPGSAATTAPAD